jgi:2,5-diamino-6-(ribosylamino)-4(3H)-pyrimidinone 5'-phosphate reductase
MDRPHVIVNCAMSADGKIALPSRKQLKISSEEDIKRMYKLRNECDAALVGIETILSDDPKLTVKEKYIENPHQPIRIILDTHCKTPEDALAVNDVAKTLIITGEECDKNFSDNVEIIQCELDEDGLIDLHRLLEILADRGIKTLMVEGGSTVIWNFLKHKLVDDLYVYIGPIIVGGKDTPTLADGNGINSIDEIINLEIVEVNKIGSGILIHYKMIK